MKKRTIQFLGLIEVSILLSTLLLFVLSNPNSLQYFIDYTTKELGLEYGSISGNLLKTVTVKDIKYQGEILSKEASINWNFRSLLSGSIKIDQIAVQKLNIPLTQIWIKDLNQKYASKDNTSIKEIPTVEVSELIFSALPFKQEQVDVHRIEFQANNIKGDLRHIDIGFFSFLTQNNYTNITALGNFIKGGLYFEKLWVEDMNVTKIMNMYHQQKSMFTDHNKTKKQTKQKFIKSFKADDIIINILPLQLKKYHIRHSSCQLFDVSSDLKKIYTKKIDINASTNMWTITSKGKIKDSALYTKVDLQLDDNYFKRFVPFFDFNKIQPISIDLQADAKNLRADIALKANDLLIGQYKELNASLPQVNAHVDFNFQTLQMDGEVNASIQTAYTKEATVEGRVYYHHGFTYDGILNIPTWTNVNPSLSKLLQQGKIVFYGNTKKITANFENKYLRANYDGKLYQKELLRINSKDLQVKDFYQKLPPNLASLTAKMIAEVPISFKHFMPLQTKYTLFSNLVNIDGNLTFDTKVHTNAHISQVKNQALWKQIDPKIKTNALFPAKLTASYENKTINAKLSAPTIQADIYYETNNSDCNTTLKIAKQPIYITGNINKDLNITLKSRSLRELQDETYKLYHFDKLPIDAAFNLKTTITKLSKIHTILSSQWFVYEYKPNRFMFAEKIRLNATYDHNLLTLHNYYFSTYLDRDRIFFANRPSLVSLYNKKINLKSLWINDGINAHGQYQINTGKGEIDFFAQNYHYNDLEGNLYIDSKIKMLLNQNKTSIEGTVFLNKGTIAYEHKKEHYIQDEDIVIIQKEQEVTDKQDKHLSLDISIESKKAIQYKVKDTDIKLDIDLKVWKEIQKNVELLGIVKVIKGFHVESDKEFEIEPGEILFGGNFLNPYLNLKATHISDPYTIYITVNGQLDSPIINFTATPYLTQSDILSILLFNSTTGELVEGGQDASKTAISMFGNAFAKEIVQNFGIKLDKLVLSTTQEGKIGVELGKKLSKKITLIYINDIVQTMKIRYFISDHFESDFTFSPDNSGIDIIYKDEY